MAANLILKACYYALSRAAFLVAEDKSFAPLDLSFLGAARVVFLADFGA